MHLLLLQRKKINAAPIFSLLKLYAEIWHLFQDAEIGEALIFLRCNNSKWICACLQYIK